MKENVPEILSYCYLDCLNRALLRNSKQAIEAFKDFYEEHKLGIEFEPSEVILEASSHDNQDFFIWSLERYNGQFPLICVYSLILNKNYSLLETLLIKYSKFIPNNNDPENSEIPWEFLKIIENDVLLNYTLFKRITHPIFSDHIKCNLIKEYNLLQLAVMLDDWKLVKLILDHTEYKASTPLKNGDNIVHLILKNSQRLNEVANKIVCDQFFSTKSNTDGLNCFEYCTGNKIHFPVLCKFEQNTENNMFMMSKVIDFEIIHDLTNEEEDKIDKKCQAEINKELNRCKFKNLLCNTKELKCCNLIISDFYEELKIDFTDSTFMSKMPKLKDKPCAFIDNIDELSEACIEIKKERVIGVDLEFCGDKRTTIASLLQISTIYCDYIIDTLILRESVGPILTPIFNNKDIVKVFHGCDYDILLLLSDLEIEVLNVFDTARAYGFMNKIGLQADPPMVSFEFLVNKLLGIKADKFFQVAEWRLRPIPKVMINYCRADSHYLLYKLSFEYC